ncbi:hypothetical protein O6H91_02G090700 [Diphasiastrum complanatum]|uniref:Uncharacterized protein n=1 Tax=Diphasiastrum complanatum TaxID=34168 RepID=A0ACC2EID0_DIPCM|nr:hypothetical protein O6H91_02G090700 [Diphasiastrum complanatum]
MNDDAVKAALRVQFKLQTANCEQSQSAWTHTPTQTASRLASMPALVRSTTMAANLLNLLSLHFLCRPLSPPPIIGMAYALILDSVTAKKEEREVHSTKQPRGPTR